MKNQKIITNATWSGDEKSVDFTTNDIEKMGNHNLVVKGTAVRYTIEVGAENWEEENEDDCRAIIAKQLLNEGIEVVNDDYSIN